MNQQHIVRETRRTVLAGIAATLAPGAQAQLRDAMRRLGVLIPIAKSDPRAQADAAALSVGLSALNWKEGGNLRIDWRWAGGDPTLFERYAAELIALNPEVLLAAGNPVVEALRRRTSTIPIVITVVSSPVERGIVQSLAHPGGNITGFSLNDPPMAGKWLQILTQITPPIAHVSVLFNPETLPNTELMMSLMEEAARTLTVTVRAAPVRDGAEIEATMAELVREEHFGLLVPPDIFTTVHRHTIVDLAARHRLPAVYGTGDFTKDGGLMSYATDITDLYRRSAAYIDRILNGAKPSDLPVQMPTKFELVINLKTAKALGVTVAPSLLATADEVIE